jgi:thymidine kinase
MAKELNYDAEAALKEEEEQRKKLMEEENKKIEELKKQEEEKAKEQTQYISVNEIDILDNAKIYKNQKLAEKNKVWTDELFQPLKKNLCPVDSYGRWNFPE